MTTLTLTTQTFTFRSDDSMCNFNILNPHYNVSILVELKQSDEKKYYYINYSYEFIPNKNISIEENNKFSKSAHPFYGFAHLESKSYDSEIVYYNKMSEQMVEHLLMPNNILGEMCGLSDVQYYRKLIIASLSNFLH